MRKRRLCLGRLSFFFKNSDTKCYEDYIEVVNSMVNNCHPKKVNKLKREEGMCIYLRKIKLFRSGINQTKLRFSITSLLITKMKTTSK